MKNSDQKKVAFDPHGNKVVFYERDHKYLLEDDPKKRMTSVTTLIKRCFPVFDGPAVAAKVAPKQGTDPETLLAKWKKKGEEASKLGTLVHLMAENMLKANDLTINDHLHLSEKEAAYLQCLKTLIPKMLERAEFIDAEKIVFDSERMVSGTIDLVMRSKETGQIIIPDWKTNEKIEQENPWQSGLGKMSHLDDCKLNHYSLQLHVYRQILLDRGYATEGQDVQLVLVHLLYDDGVVRPVFPKVPDLSKEAKLILDKKA